MVHLNDRFFAVSSNENISIVDNTRLVAEWDVFPKHDIVGLRASV